MVARQSLEGKGTGPTADGLNRPIKSSLLRYQQSKSEYFICVFVQPSGDKTGHVIPQKDLQLPDVMLLDLP